MYLVSYSSNLTHCRNSQFGIYIQVDNANTPLYAHQKLMVSDCSLFSVIDLIPTSIRISKIEIFMTFSLRHFSRELTRTILRNSINDLIILSLVKTHHGLRIQSTSHILDFRV